MVRICYGICDRFLGQIEREHRVGRYRYQSLTKSYTANYDRRVVKMQGSKGSYDKDYYTCIKCGICVKKYVGFSSDSGRVLCPCCSQQLRTVRRDI